MILVTGGTGFIGRRIVAGLIAAGHDVAVLARSAPLDLPPQVRIVEGDLVALGASTVPLAGVDTIVHLAGTLGPSELVALNVDAARALAVAATHAKVRRFVHCSSAGVYGDSESLAPLTEHDAPRPATPYERSKWDGESAVRDVLGHEIPWVILRPSGVYGPGRPATLEFLRRIQRRRFWLHGSATVIVHPTYVDDLSSAVTAVIERRDLANEVINIGGERSLSFPDLIAANARALGTSVRQASLPAACRQLAAAAKTLGLTHPRVDRMARAVINRGLDTSKAARLLGIRPIPLDEGISKTVASFRADGRL